ncbi:NBR1-Ig-like domain-containing protein [Actinomadura chibensis]|uniref:Helix-turn-helix domain-containing protein n=1 Tax=Actinomadura chibensis TaxID=392828 RepID=A0A5D0NEZ4_9ACTN|nr:NBR1-Ig-like domain-containing protein [Actinomadura chibensis]TYB42996.1 helix-turn-helix domain-containing protein [Actinomadura chibensis]
MGDSGVLSSAGGQEGRDRFAERLRRLRAEAGNPSFRVMASKSRSVSHATLHEAARGTRFPSWTTTQAFVEACGGDVEEWREYWCAVLDSDGAAERSDPAEQRESAPAASPAPLALVPAGDVDEVSAVEADERAAVTTLVPASPPGRRRRRRVLAIVLGGAAVGGAVAGASLIRDSGGRPGRPQEAAVKSGQPAVASAPVIAGDRSVFIGDVTIPDGTVVKTGQQFIKTWELANAGTVPWHGRFLARATLPADNGTCSTPGKVPIRDTKPGAHVRVSVHVTAPASPGSCWVGWKMVDGEGRQLLPGARPVYFVVNVAR